MPENHNVTGLKALAKLDDNEIMALYNDKVDQEAFDGTHMIAWWDFAFGWFYALTHSKPRSDYLAHRVLNQQNLR